MSDLREEYDETGYVIARGAIDPDLAPDTIAHVHWRVGLTLRYVPTTTWVRKENHADILFRGDPDPSAPNGYAHRPRYIEGKQMPVRGCES